MKSIFVIVLLIAAASALPPRPFKLDGRIVGGQDIDISEVPWQISLLYYGSHMCGGSIISAEWVVTAAHCTDGTSARELSIRAGSSTLEQGGQTSDVDTIYQNPRYSDDTLDYDISVLKLSTPLTLGANVAAVKLPSSTDSWPDGTEILVTGWGTTHEDDDDLPSHLQGVTINIVNKQECQDDYFIYPITDRMICAGVEEGGKDSCQGDSGGPLVVDGNTLIGLVSWGIGCAERGYPGVNTYVPALRDYVTETTGL